MQKGNNNIVVKVTNNIVMLNEKCVGILYDFQLNNNWIIFSLL